MSKCQGRGCHRDATVRDSNNKLACAKCAIAAMVAKDPTVQAILDRQRERLNA